MIFALFQCVFDAVFHLVTAAKGAEAAYTCANNQARTESVAEEAALDDRLLAAWTGHPHLRVIDNSSDFEDKMKRLIAEISFFLGEPEPLEIVFFVLWLLTATALAADLNAVGQTVGIWLQEEGVTITSFTEIDSGGPGAGRGLHHGGTR